MRDSYCFRLTGKSITNFENKNYEMLNEVSRCKGISDVKYIELETDELSNKPVIKVVTDNYEDYNKLLKPWLPNAFGSGVKPKPGLLNIQMIIETKFKEEEDEDPLDDQKHIRHLEKTGLFLPKRPLGQEKRKIRVFVDSLKTFVDWSSKEYIMFNKGSHKIKPSIKVTYPCTNCGNLANHGKDGLNCKNTKKCLKCGSAEQDHQFNRCEKTPCCINCNQNHYTNDYLQEI